MISVAGSIKWRKQDGLMASFDNTMLSDQRGEGGFPYLYGHKVYGDDTLTIQAEVTTGYTISIWYSEECWKPWVALAGETLKTSGTYYDYYELELAFNPFANYKSVQFKCEILNGSTVTETWISEPCEIATESDDNGLMQVEFFNLENDFHVDYTTGLSHLLRIESKLSEYKPAGEMSVFDNQNEVVKIKDEVKRTLVWKTEPIPAYLAEMLRVALAHDKFFINEVEFVAESNPEYEANLSNLGSFTVNLTQKNIIGINTHDVGFDCDAITTNADMIVLQELAASGQKSFAITDDYMILTITGERTAGSPVITAGTTPGGTDVLFGMSLTASYLVEVALVPFDKASIPGGTLYVTVSGAGATANIYVATIKNRQ